MDQLDPAWFCIRTKPRRQNVAAAHLRSFDLEVFNPQFRTRRATRNGPIWRTEPLFPNYLFARFEFADRYRRVRYAFGVHDILNFGGQWARIPEADIAALRREWQEREELEVDPQIFPGDTVQLTGLLFHGMEARVLCLLPARQRVKVLLDFLGGLKETEVDTASVVPSLRHPLAA